MDEFNELIKLARKGLGYGSAKEFYRAKKDDLSSSYESYANIEAGKYLPPVDKLMGLTKALEIQDLRKFLYSYCWTLMPNELFKSLFADDGSRGTGLILKSDSYTNYKEKFHALLEFNRLQSKHELTTDQITYLETDLTAWDILNLFVSAGDLGLTVEQIAEKTDSGMESTRSRITELVRVEMLKPLENGKRYLVTQDAFIIPRKPAADRLTQELVKREIDQCLKDKRNRPYMRFRFMSIDPAERENFEMFIDNFILDSRRFKKTGGRTHYLQVLFSDRNDLD